MKTPQVAERKKLKARIPKLVRQESWRYERVKEAWRRPRGVTNKMRRGQQGWPKTVSAGYKTPNDLRHLHPSGFKEVMVNRVEDLEKLDAKTYVAKISHTVGEKKRVAIVNRAEELQIRVVNPRVTRREEVPEAKEPPIEEREAPEEQPQPDVKQEQFKEEEKP